MGAKFGIAGELISFNNLYFRQIFTLLIIVLFFFLDWLSRKTIKVVYIRNIFYFTIALLAIFLVLNDIKYVDYLMPYTNKINSKIFVGGFFVLIVALGYFLEREYDDTYKTVRLSKAILETILVVLFLKLYNQNSDFDDKFRFFIVLGACLLYFWFIIKKISTEFNIKIASLVTYIVIVGFIVVLATRNLELYKFPKLVLDAIGYIFGAVILVLVATCYVANTKTKIRNVREKPFIEIVEDWLLHRLGNYAKDFAKILIIFLIVLSFFFPTVLMAVVPILIASFFQKSIDNWINKYSPKEEFLQEKKKMAPRKKLQKSE